MILAAMQPYLLPYIGYWQLIFCCDTFVLLDDVNYKQRSWISRNRFLCDGSIRYFNIPVSKASQNRYIGDTEFLFIEKQRMDMLSTFRYAYRKAPYVNVGCELLAEIMMNRETDITSFLEESIKHIFEYLDLDLSMKRASEIRRSFHAKNEEGIIELCDLCKSSGYINLPGGRQLYHADAFSAKGLQLRFLMPDMRKMQDYSGLNQTDLSILDLIMRFSKEEIREMLSLYDLQE